MDEQEINAVMEEAIRTLTKRSTAALELSLKLTQVTNEAKLSTGEVLLALFAVVDAARSCMRTSLRKRGW